MSKTRIEYTGNIQVHHPVKPEPEVIEYQPWLEEEWQAIQARAILHLMGPIRNPFVDGKSE